MIVCLFIFYSNFKLHFHTALATSFLHLEARRASGPIFPRIFHRWIMSQAKGHHRLGSGWADWCWPTARKAETKCSISAYFRHCNAPSDILFGCRDRGGDETMGDGDLSSLPIARGRREERRASDDCPMWVDSLHDDESSSSSETQNSLDSFYRLQSHFTSRFWGKSRRTANNNNEKAEQQQQQQQRAVVISCFKSLW